MRTRRFLVKLTAEPVQVREQASVELPKPASEMWSWI